MEVVDFPNDRVRRELGLEMPVFAFGGEDDEPSEMHAGSSSRAGADHGAVPFVLRWQAYGEDRSVAERHHPEFLEPPQDWDDGGPISTWEAYARDVPPEVPDGGDRTTGDDTTGDDTTGDETEEP